jgi:hypothetical protein
MSQNVRTQTSHGMTVIAVTEHLDWVGVQPITVPTGTWTPAQDAVSQDEWSMRVGQAIGSTKIIQACNSNSLPPTWGAEELIATKNTTAQTYVKHYAHHNYPGGTLTNLMSHVNIAGNMALFVTDVAAANGAGKEYVLGETNSGKPEMPTNIAADVLTCHSLGRRCHSCFSYLWSRSMDHGLHSESVRHEHQTHLFPPWHTWSLLLLLVGPLYSRSPLLRRLPRNSRHGWRIIHLSPRCRNDELRHIYNLRLSQKAAPRPAVQF